MDGHDELVRLYGPWASRSPSHAVDLFEGYDGRWWIAGGWAIEAFTGVSRRHGDLDPALPRSDVGRLRHHVMGRYDVWSADSGSLRPLLDPADDVLAPSCVNLWLRPSGRDPWEFDIVVNSVENDVWTFHRDPRIREPLEDILWVEGGISYLRPEVQLLHKALLVRPVDQADFDACLPLLGDKDRRWLVVALRIAHPGHPWLGLLG